MSAFEIVWCAPSYNDGELVEETVSFDYFEDALEDLLRRLEDHGVAEDECFYQIAEPESDHIYIISDKGKCVVRGW